MEAFIVSWINKHPTTAALLAFWFFSNLVSAMPSPQSQVSFYRFVFNFCHGMAGSAGRIFPALRIPGPGASDAPAAPETKNGN